MEMITRTKFYRKSKQTPFIYLEGKEFKEKDVNNIIKKENEMVKRRNIGGKYYEVRERSTSAGKRGTIRKSWKPKKKKSIWGYYLGR